MTSLASNVELEIPYRLRLQFSRLLLQIYMAIDHRAIHEALVAQRPGVHAAHEYPGELTTHTVLADAVQYLQIKNHGFGTITSLEVRGYSIQEIVGVLRNLLGNPVDSDGDSDMSGSEGPDPLQRLKEALRLVITMLEGGIWPVEPVARLYQTDIRNIASVGFDTAENSSRFTNGFGSHRQGAQVSATPVTPDNVQGSTYPQHLSQRARDHVSEWAHSTAGPTSVLVQGEPGSSILRPIAYVAPVEVRHTPGAVSAIFNVPADRRSPPCGPTSAPRSNPFAAQPLRVINAPGSVTAIFREESLAGSEASLPSYASSRPVDSRGESPYPDGGNCSIAPGESCSQDGRHYPGAPPKLREGTISPQPSNCSIAPSESVSQAKYDLSVRDHYTWKAHPYRNAPKPGEIVGGAKYFKEINGTIIALEEPSEVDADVGREMTDSDAESSFRPVHAVQAAARFPIDSTSPREASQPHSEGPSKRVLTSTSSEARKQPRLGMGLGSIGEPIGDLTEGNAVERALDMIDQMIDDYFAKNQ